MFQDVFKLRQKLLIEQLTNNFNASSGLILLFSGFELDCRYPFRPENNFFYLTGVSEPGVVAVIDLQGRCDFLQPSFTVNRAVWESKSPAAACLATAKPLGQKIAGYELKPVFSCEAVENLLIMFAQATATGAQIFTCQTNSDGGMSGLSAGWFFTRIKTMLSAGANFVDASEVVTGLRRIKDTSEVQKTTIAVNACIAAQQLVARKITPGVTENYLKHQLQAEFDAQNSGSLAFRSIVASGKNSTILHATPSNKILQINDLVVVDIGCEFAGYSSDLTRTFPVGRKFSARQKELYNLVLEAQKLAETTAKTNVFLRGTKDSLHALVVNFFAGHGLQQYFPHGLGHYLGLDVHDVGSYQKPLEPGCIFTIEPGLYLPEENIGIRIEDNYLMTPEGALKLSQNLVSETELIEELMHEK